MVQVCLALQWPVPCLCEPQLLLETCVSLPLHPDFEEGMRDLNGSRPTLVPRGLSEFGRHLAEISLVDITAGKKGSPKEWGGEGMNICVLLRPVKHRTC